MGGIGWKGVLGAQLSSAQRSSSAGWGVGGTSLSSPSVQPLCSAECTAPSSISAAVGFGSGSGAGGARGQDARTGGSAGAEHNATLGADSWTPPGGARAVFIKGAVNPDRAAEQAAVEPQVHTREERREATADATGAGDAQRGRPRRGEERVGQRRSERARGREETARSSPHRRATAPRASSRRTQNQQMPSRLVMQHRGNTVKSSSAAMDRGQGAQ